MQRKKKEERWRRGQRKNKVGMSGGGEVKKKK